MMAGDEDVFGEEARERFGADQRRLMRRLLPASKSDIPSYAAVAAGWVAGFMAGLNVLVTSAIAVAAGVVVGSPVWLIQARLKAWRKAVATASALPETKRPETWMVFQVYGPVVLWWAADPGNETHSGWALLARRAYRRAAGVALRRQGT